MRNWVRGIFLMLAMAAAVGVAQAQDGLPLPSPVEKELAAKASHVTEVTLGKNMLSFAAKFMNSKDKDDAGVAKLIQGLEGIYVREYEFDKEGQYSSVDVERLRQHFETEEWTSLVRERDRKTGQTTDVMIKNVNGKSGGLFVLEAGAKELTVVLILGPINMEDLGKLKGIGGLDALGEVQKNVHRDDEKKGAR